MSSSSSFCWVKIILLVEVLHNGCWINPPVTIPEGRMEFIWIHILKLIKAKSATPERVFSLQNFVLDHDFLLTLLERSKLCFSKHKSFIRFFMMGSASSDSERKKYLLSCSTRWELRLSSIHSFREVINHFSEENCCIIFEIRVFLHVSK